MNLKEYLKQPFPKLESRWKLIILISVFVALFLIIFQPFGITYMKGNNKILILSGYGIVTFIALLFNLIIIENLFPKIFIEKNWTIRKEFAWLMWVVFSIGLGNAIYTNFLIEGYFQVNFSFFVSFQLYTIIIGTIPISILIITKQKYLLKKHLDSANDLNKSIHKSKHENPNNQAIYFYSDNGKDFVELELNNFLFMESSGNYVNIYFNFTNEVVRKTLRNTIKNSLTLFKDNPEVLQCHRAFIVNTNKIINAKGNSQGLRLALENCDSEVPVSRGYVETIKQKLSTIRL